MIQHLTEMRLLQCKQFSSSYPQVSIKLQYTIKKLLQCFVLFFWFTHQCPKPARHLTPLPAYSHYSKQYSIDITRAKIFKIITYHLVRSKPDVDRRRNAWLELFRTADDLDTCILRFFKNASELSKHGGGGRSFKITGPDLWQTYSE